MGIIERKKRILLNEPHLAVTTPVGVANFSTDMVGKLAQCKVEFSPVQSGSGDPSPSNVRPITGWTGCNVYRTGKNLYNSTIEQGGFNSSTGAEASFSIRVRSGYIYLKGGTYTVNAANASNIRVIVYIYDTDQAKTYMKSELVNVFVNPPYTFTLAGDRNIRLLFRKETGTQDIVPSDISNVQIEVGELASQYEPYTSTTYPISWTDQGTVYGGYVDLASGELVATWGSVKVKDCSWTYDSTYKRFRATISDFKGNSAVRTTYYMFSAGIVYYNNESLSTVTNYGTYAYSTNVYIKDTDHTTEEQFKTAIGEERLVYNLITPVTYQLTPQQIKTLIGQNNIWSNTNGNVTVKYWKH